MKHSVKVSLMAIVALFAYSTLANAQFGGLLNKAKKAAKETVNKNTDSNTQSSASSTSSSSKSTSPVAATKKIELTNYYISFNEGVKTDWDYNSSYKDIESDMKYWLHRLRTSVEKGDPDAIDKEALERLAYGTPDFEYVNKKYHRYDETFGMYSDKMNDAKVEAIQYAYKILDGTTTPWNPMGDTDEQKAKKQEEIFKMKKAALLNRYKWNTTHTFKVAAITGNDANLKKIAQELFPEWGKIIATKMGTKSVPNTDFPGQGKRVVTGSVLCEDQGYKVLHYIPFIAPEKAGEKPKLPEGVVEKTWLEGGSYLVK